MQTKRCPVCRENKKREHFNRAARYKDGLQPKCRSCEKAYYLANRDRHKATVYAWRAANQDEHKARVAASYLANPKKEYHAAYRASNLERCRARTADWAARNKDRRNKVTAEWAAKNTARRRETARIWRIANKDKQCAKSSRHRAAKMRALPQWADLDGISVFYAEAQRITRETGIVHHVDHIVPLQSKLVCGLHVPCNLQVIPGDQNMSKSNRHWPDMAPAMEAA